MEYIKEVKKSRAYAIEFIETEESKPDERLQVVSYDQTKQVSVFNIGGVEVTAEALLESTPDGTLRDIVKEEAVTGGGTGKRDFFWI